MAEKIVISQLTAKRAEIAGEIQKAEKQLDKLRADLASIDRALLIFDPKINPKAIGPRPKRTGAPILPYGVFARAVLDVLRHASAPMTAKQVALQIAKEHDLAVTPALLVRYSSKVRTACANNKHSLTKERTLDGAVWSVAG